MNSARKTRGQIRLYLLIVRVVHQFWFISTAKNPEKLWALRFLDDNRKSLKKVIPVVVSEAARLGKSSFECRLRCTESHYRVCFLQKSLSQHALPMCRLLPSFFHMRPSNKPRSFWNDCYCFPTHPLHGISKQTHTFWKKNKKCRRCGLLWHCK